MAELFDELGEVTVPHLIADTDPIHHKNVTIAKSGKLTRGTVLGKITASGSYAIADSTATDGSQTAECILAEDVDATDADVVANVYISGAFIIESLTFGGTDTAETHEDALYKNNIRLVHEN